MLPALDSHKFLCHAICLSPTALRTFSHQAMKKRLTHVSSLVHTPLCKIAHLSIRSCLSHPSCYSSNCQRKQLRQPIETCPFPLSFHSCTDHRTSSHQAIFRCLCLPACHWPTLPSILHHLRTYRFLFHALYRLSTFLRKYLHLLKWNDLYRWLYRWQSDLHI